MADNRKPCCRDAANLELISSVAVTLTALSSNGPVPRTGVESCHRCRVCGCRHFELAVDPGQYACTPSPVG